LTRRIRNRFIKETVNNLFIHFKIICYPIDILDIFMKYKKEKIKICKVIPYSKHMRKYNLTTDEVINLCGSEEGCTDYHPIKKRYLVYYNDLPEYHKTHGRIRWTLAHELGHILLNHHNSTERTKLFRNELSNGEYDWMEEEANHFASLLLANAIILDKLDIKNKFDILEICDLTKEASGYRFQGYLSWRKYKYINYADKKILKQFEPFIYNATHSYHCSDCQIVFVAENANYCPICGNKPEKMRLHIRSDFDMIYPGFEVDEKSQLIQCPWCGNEEIDDKAEYCKVCCKPVINKCTNFNCDELAVGNARYCILCGAKTTFYEYGLLKDWQEVISEENVAATNLFDDKPDVPF